MQPKANHSAFALALLSSAAFFAPAQAQTQEVAAVTESVGLEEIVVTARKREERLQDTPIAISAFSAEGLEQRAISTVTELGDFAPNVKFNSAVPVSATNATAAIFIRGIGQNDYQLSADPGVGLYLDGVYISRGVGNVLDVLNIERIEILRGPQGTLFGRNTIGGAVNVITKKPGDTFSGNAELTTGRFNRIQGRVSLDLPIADTLAASVTGMFHKRDGHVKGVVNGAPDLGDTDSASGRIALRWTPADTVEVNLSVDGSRSREQSAPNVLIGINEGGGSFVQAWNGIYSGNPGLCTGSSPARLTNPACINSQYLLGPYRHAGTFQSISPLMSTLSKRRYESGSDVDIWGVSGTVDWDASDLVSVKSITAYRKVTGFWARDPDHTPAGVVGTINNWTQDQFSQELQLTGRLLDEKLNWVVGAYYSKESGNHQDFVNVLDAVFLSGAVLDGKSYAFFGQATYEIVPDLNLTAGIRWTQDQKTFGNANQFVIEAGFITGAPLNPDGSGLADGDPLMGPLGREAKITDKAWTPMVSLSYRWTPELMTYASYSEGFKGGGFTQRVFPPLGRIPSFEPEFSTTYEVGFKADLLDNRMRLNGALFHNDYDNLQITVNDPILGFAPIIQNAAKARIQGFELEMQARPTEALRIEASIGYLDAKYRQVAISAAAGGAGGGVTVNDRLQNAPEWTLSAGISYKIDLADTGSLTPRLDWTHRSTVANDAVNTPLLIQDGYSLLNAAMSYASANEKWQVTLGVKNITKEEYLVAGYDDAGTGITEGVFGRPREWHLSIKTKF
jgi:iron complex outermembrane recepter protein